MPTELLQWKILRLRLQQIERSKKKKKKVTENKYTKRLKLEITTGEKVKAKTLPYHGNSWCYI